MWRQMQTKPQAKLQSDQKGINICAHMKAQGLSTHLVPFERACILHLAKGSVALKKAALT